MSKQSVTKGATSQICFVFIRDSSASTGVGLTGLAFNTASLVASYVRPAGSRTAITLATQTVTGAYSSGGFVEVDATNMPGVYRLDVPDAVFATGVNSAVVMLKGASNMEPCLIEFELKGVDLQDAVRAGLTALPNAAAEAAGGLYTRGTGAGQINQPANGVIDTNTKTWNALTTVALPLVPTTAGRTLDVSATGEAGVDWANVGSPTTTVALTGTTIAATQQVDVNTIKTQAVTAAAGVTFPASIASPTNITAGTVTTVSGNVSGSVGSVVGLTASNLDATISSRASATNLATVAGYIDTEVASILAVTNKLDTSMELDGSVYRFTANALEQAPTGGSAPTASAIADEVQTRTIAAVTIVNGLAANVITAAATASDFTSEVTAALATSSALTAVAGDVTAVKAKTDGLPSDPADQSLVIAATDAIMGRLGAPDGASVSADVAAVKADTAAVLLDTGTGGVVVAAASKTGYRLSSTGVNDLLRTALTEGYAADGAEFTLEQALYMLWSLLAERSIASTTLTAKKLDGSTSAMTFTLDDATTPTAQTRAT